MTFVASFVTVVAETLESFDDDKQLLFRTRLAETLGAAVQPSDITLGVSAGSIRIQVVVRSPASVVETLAALDAPSLSATLGVQITELTPVSETLEVVAAPAGNASTVATVGAVAGSIVALLLCCCLRCHFRVRKTRSLKLGPAAAQR